ncbi:MAG TPA: sulfotransferase [Gemmataceae bacterium]|nr:sulfotransferase [Gemmataceae bacterium]
MNPFVFIVGCPRSGTTLLQRMVDAHRQIAITPETHWIAPYFVRRKGLTPEGWVTPKLIRKLLAHPKFSRLGIGHLDLKKLLKVGGPVSYGRFVSGIYDLYGRAQGKHLVGDKTPGYARAIGILHHLWPGAKFVHLIRDGRDVCLSALEWRRPGKLLSRLAIWGEDRVVAAALWWEWHVRLGRQAGNTLPRHQYHEIRYESLVARPAEECATLCAFLDVPYDEAMLRFHEKRPRSDQADHPWMPILAELRDWRSQMPAENVERFEAAAGALLAELGYPRGSAQVRPKTLEQVARLRDLFVLDVAPDGCLPLQRE